MTAIVFMPWANLTQPITLGRVRFKLWSQARQKFTGSDLHNLDKMFSRFYDIDGRHLPRTTICEFCGNIMIPKIEQKDIEEIRESVNALAFATIAPGVLSAVANNKQTSGPSNADRYSLFCWSLFQDGRIDFKVGSIIYHTSVETLDIRQPLHVVARGDKQSRQILKDMTKVFEFAMQGNEDAKRIIRSLEWFKASQTNSQDVSFRSKLVMLSTAFEVLLNFPKIDKAKYFAERIDAMKSPAGTDLHGCLTINNKNWKFSKRAIWAYNFYQLRNEIVHGMRYVHPHEIWYKVSDCDFLNFDLLGCILFNECVARKMSNLGLNASLNHQPWLPAYRLIEWVC